MRRQGEVLLSSAQSPPGGLVSDRLVGDKRPSLYDGADTQAWADHDQSQ